MIEYKNLSLANQVYDKIEEDILNGTYAIGEVLSEKRLCQDLGVSRTPIREALSRLSQEKLIRDSSNGTVVVGITEDDLKDLLEVKRRVEVVAFRRAVDNISEKGMEKLKQILDEQEYYAQKDNSSRVRDLDTEFHDIIYRESGSTVLEGVLSAIHHKMMKYRKASLEQENRIMDSVKEHRAILDAIANKDKDKLDTLVLIHIDHAYNSMMEGSN